MEFVQLVNLQNLKEKFEELKKKFQDNENDEVIKECKKILKKNKIDVFYNLLCLAYNNKGDSNKAIEVMNEALMIVIGSIFNFTLTFSK